MCCFLLSLPRLQALHYSLRSDGLKVYRSETEISGKRNEREEREAKVKNIIKCSRAKVYPQQGSQWRLLHQLLSGNKLQTRGKHNGIMNLRRLK